MSALGCPNYGLLICVGSLDQGPFGGSSTNPWIVHLHFKLEYQIKFSKSQNIY